MWHEFLISLASFAISLAERELTQHVLSAAMNHELPLAADESGARQH